MNPISSDDFFDQLLAQAVNDAIPAVVVGVAVIEAGRVLLLKRRSDDFMPDVWEVPGGHVDAGETVADAVRRELWEETGLRLSAITGYLGYYDYPGEFGMTRQWNFRVEVDPWTTITHPEHASHCWSDKRHALMLPMTKEMAELVDMLPI
ncbi:NUDIX hydrolase [Sulfobacillus harzensis]|uniref:NUDIX hydrolase n=1 Tax=Sulfobacillus harzensis TaxID=2729629 RepID=A0A7Y0L4W7_9FIRM|nr:NUDIX hydrolase [Sulfobacillus harzensis]NMP23346.1 NUDIX hydrolase [Sulfobacillus harzensis]